MHTFKQIDDAGNAVKNEKKIINKTVLFCQPVSHKIEFSCENRLIRSIFNKKDFHVQDGFPKRERKSVLSEKQYFDRVSFEEVLEKFNFQYATKSFKYFEISIPLNHNPMHLKKQYMGIAFKTHSYTHKHVTYT